ncbi:MAG: type II secretion system protein [Gammaproteobacteria bacterium]|nr:type II secretion system protein [Gammaproteobacteria bacterium]
MTKMIQSGFTLLELVLGIAVMSVVLLLMTGALFPQAEKSTDPWFQVRSAELAQSLMNEILARRYDENSLVIGNLRCGETGASACITQTQLDNCASTEEGSDRVTWDDVDDFNCLNVSGDSVLANIEGDVVDAYAQFNVQVSVNYNNTFSTPVSSVSPAKLITITVTPPRGPDVVYSSFKANY